MCAKALKQELTIPQDARRWHIMKCDAINRCELASWDGSYHVGASQQAQHLVQSNMPPASLNASGWCSAILSRYSAGCDGPGPGVQRFCQSARGKGLLTEQSTTDPKVSSSIHFVAWLTAEYVGKGQLAKDLFVRGKCAAGTGNDLSANGSIIPPVCAQTPGVCPAIDMKNIMPIRRVRVP